MKTTSIVTGAALLIVSACGANVKYDDALPDAGAGVDASADASFESPVTYTEGEICYCGNAQGTVKLIAGYMCLVSDQGQPIVCELGAEK